MFYGFSLSQLVFGGNPDFLSFIAKDKLHALAGTTRNDEVAQHLNAKPEARKAFVECKAAEKVKRALRHNMESLLLKYMSQLIKFIPNG